MRIPFPSNVNQFTHSIERRISGYRLVTNAMTTGPTGACSTAPLVQVADCSSVAMNVKMEIRILEAVSLSFLSFIGWAETNSVENSIPSREECYDPGDWRDDILVINGRPTSSSDVPDQGTETNHAGASNPSNLYGSVRIRWHPVSGPRGTAWGPRCCVRMEGWSENSHSVQSTKWHGWTDPCWVFRTGGAAASNKLRDLRVLFQ